MTIRDETQGGRQPVNRYTTALQVYGFALSIVMMLLGLRQWAIILGVIAGPTGMFEAMSTAWKIATMHLAVVDLVAAVGLWMRVAWGQVVWIYAALSEIALHTIFAGTFGGDLTVVVFHFLTFAVFIILTLIARRAAVHQPR